MFVTTCLQCRHLVVLTEQERSETLITCVHENSSLIITCEPGHEKTCLMSYANNKGADQPAHTRILISAFVVHCLDSVMYLVSVTKIPSLCLASLAAQAGLRLIWLEIPKTGFLVTRLMYLNWTRNNAYEPRHEKTCFSHTRTTKVRISLRIRAV